MIPVPLKWVFFATISMSNVTSVLAAQPAESTKPQTPELKPYEPDVPADLAAKGTLYYTLSGGEAQVLFTSPAPLENIVGKSNRVVGYAVAGPAEGPAALVGAHWVLPVNSIATGIPLRDSHLAGEDWLDARAHPTIEFKLTRVEDIAHVKEGEGYSTWSATLIGQMTIHGVTRELRVPDTRISLLDASERTAGIAPGNLMFVKSSYAVRLSDFGITNKDVPDKVSDEIVLEQTIRLSTVKRSAAELPSESR